MIGWVSDGFEVSKKDGLIGCDMMEWVDRVCCESYLVP